MNIYRCPYRVAWRRTGGQRFDPRPFRCHSHPRQVVHTCVPPFTKQYNLVPAKGGDAMKLVR